MKSTFNLLSALLCRTSRLWGCEKWSSPLTMRTGRRGQCWEGRPRARSWRALPKALAGVYVLLLPPFTRHCTRPTRVKGRILY